MTQIAFVVLLLVVTIIMTRFHGTISSFSVVIPTYNKSKKPTAITVAGVSPATHLQSSSSSSSINIKVCQNKDCCKNFPSKYDGGLIQTLQDLVVLSSSCGGPSSTSRTGVPTRNITVESSGCLSQCNHGPNICVNERVFGKIDGVLAAAAVLEVAANIDCSGQLMAAIEDMATANKLNDPIQKVKHLDSVIESLQQQGEATATSTAMAHALILRADAHLECIPQNPKQALQDAMLAISLFDHVVNNGRAWRIVADAKEMMGDIRGAMDAVSSWAERNLSFSAKAKKELERLSSKLNM